MTTLPNTQASNEVCSEDRPSCCLGSNSAVMPSRGEEGNGTVSSAGRKAQALPLRIGDAPTGHGALLVHTMATPHQQGSPLLRMEPDYAAGNPPNQNERVALAQSNQAPHHGATLSSVHGAAGDPQTENPPVSPARAGASHETHAGTLHSALTSKMAQIPSVVGAESSLARQSNSKISAPGCSPPGSAAADAGTISHAGQIICA